MHLVRYVSDKRRSLQNASLASKQKLSIVGAYVQVSMTEQLGNVYLETCQIGQHIWLGFQEDPLNMGQRSGECECHGVLCKEAVRLHDVPSSFLGSSIHK